MLVKIGKCVINASEVVFASISKNTLPGAPLKLIAITFRDGRIAEVESETPDDDLQRLADAIT